ncbi:MAG: hypothetical protein HN424_04520, partial [Candidatus Jacksonbacteria bacterium]|nr:hypothetical protein [Candidatus Jacksonbacteria bacterium]
MPDEKERVGIKHSVVKSLTSTTPDAEVSSMKSIFSGIQRKVSSPLLSTQETGKALDALNTIPTEDKEVIMVAVAPILQEGAAEAVVNIATILKGVTNKQGKAEFLEAVLEITEEDRAQIIADAKPILQNITDGYQIKAILKTLSEIPAEDRDKF